MVLKSEKVQDYLMFRYQVLIEYVGTNFRGWQVQKKGKTIQGLVQEKISNLLKEKIILLGSGRTDTGVHAIEQSAHFDCKNKIKDFDRFLKSINHFLNKDGVAILKIRKRISLTNLIKSDSLKGNSKKWAIKVETLHTYIPNSLKVEKLNDPMWK